MGGRRGYGTGTLYERDGFWYGRWCAPDGGRPHRRIGPARRPGAREGLTRKQAEAQLRRLMDGDQVIVRPGAATPTVESMGEALRARLEALERKRSHLETVESHLRVHLVPFFGDQPLVEIDEGDVERFMGSMRRSGSSPKTIKNVTGTLHSLFDLAIRRKLIPGNPCRLVEGPKVGGPDPDIRFLDQVELEAVLRAAPNADDDSCDQEWWRVERPLYLMAAMTGMRQGELRALRWADLDWLAQKVRVRQSFVRGEFGAPKSRRSTRAVPLAPRVLAELDRLHKWTVFDSDEDLVFCNPHTGRPMDRSKLLKRFKAACDRARVRRVRFHDLRHTFGTRIAASGKVPMRTLQEWMGHRDFKTTLIYADYQPGNQEADLVEHAFAADPMDSSMDRSEQKTTEVGESKTA